MKKTNKALVVGVSKYSSPFTQLPAVSADVREIAKLLHSKDGAFPRSGTDVLYDSKASKDAIESALERAFTTNNCDTLFVYLAGHGAVDGDSYYFIPHDAEANNLSGTSVSLSKIKDLFDQCKCERVFLWIDSCHSGGILKKRSAVDQNAIVKRTLEVVRGHGRMILAACTADQSAYEDSSIGHGLFTDALLRGLKGEAKAHGEVTAGGLYEFIDREIGSDRQRPMLFSETTGRIVLMHYGSRDAPASKPSGKAKAAAPLSNTVLLGNEFFDAESVQRNADGSFSLDILSKDSERDALIQELAPQGQHQFRQPVPFAHRNDASDVKIDEVTSTSTGEGQVWKLTLKPVDSLSNHHPECTYSEDGRTYSPEDIAVLQARAILLAEKRPVARDNRRSASLSMIDSLIERTIADTKTTSVIRDAYAANKEERSHWREFARLKAIYVLKKLGIVEHVLELSIGQVSGRKAPVSLRGKRRSSFSNQEAPIIEISGDCAV